MRIERIDKMNTGKRNSYSGYTEKTPEHLLLDSGAFFKNYEVKTDTFESAVTAGKLIGATKGGGEFKATPTIRAIEIDGIKGNAKGAQNIDTWTVTLMANVIEITRENIAMSLASSKLDNTTSEDYDIITAKAYIELSDYIENITWIGKLSGSDKPVIIQVFNALNTTGLTIQTKDKSEVVTQMIFNGHYDGVQADEPPFKIYYPKAKAVV